MSNTRQIVDFAINDQGKEARDALYAEIHDRVMAKFEEMKSGIAQNLIAPHMEAVEHDDEAEDKKLVKKMVKGKCLKTESVEDEDFEEDEDEEYEDLDEELSQFSLEELEDFMQTEEYEQLDELSKSAMGSYVQKAIRQTMSGKKDRTKGMQKAYKKMTTK